MTDKIVYYCKGCWIEKDGRYEADSIEDIPTDHLQHLHREDGPAIVMPDGSYTWYLNGQKHRISGPACFIRKQNLTMWCVNGVYHREDGPSYIKEEPDLLTEKWYYKGELHRIGEPAVLITSGRGITEEWYQNGQYHREDGPAIIWCDGRLFWCLNGKNYNLEEYLKINDKCNKMLLKLVWG